MDTFRAAAPLLPVSVEPVAIPYEGTHLSGYLIRPSTGTASPTVLFPAGYDSPAEEAYSLGAYEAAVRGFTALGFTGPGQGAALFDGRLPFRHDFEAVVGPVIDFVESRADLDSQRIALVGRSFAGYLAPRAASVERRVGALAADPAQVDMGTPLRSRLSPSMLALLDAGDPAFDEQIWAAYPGTHGKEYWLSRAHAHGVSGPLELAAEMQRWVVDVEAISCPTFVSFGEGDFAESSTQGFYDRLTVDNKRFTRYLDANGAGGHCEGMGPSRYFTDLFGWLQDLWPEDGR